MFMLRSIFGDFLFRAPKRVVRNISFVQYLKCSSHSNSSHLFFSAAEGRSTYELREKFLLPNGSSQAMQAFKLKRSGSGLRPKTPSREPSGELRVNGRSSSGAKLEVPGSGNGILRRKSDLDREGRKIPSYKAHDYSKVRSSGYGAASPLPKRKREGSASNLRGDEVRPRVNRTNSGLSSGSRDSTEDGATPPTGKITRERSGDVFSRLYGTTPKSPAKRLPSKEETTPPKSPAKRLPSKEETTPKSPAKRLPSKEETTPKSPAKRTPTRVETKPKATATPKLRVTKSKPEAKEPSSPDKPPSSPTTKPRTGGVFARLTAQGTATKKASGEEGASKTSSSSSKIPTTKARGSVKKPSTPKKS